MTTDDLLAYIQTQLKKNTAPDLIASRLVQAGWHVDDVEQGFNTIRARISAEEIRRPNNFSQEPQSQEIEHEEPVVIDPYRELPEILSSKQKLAPMRTPTLPKFEPRIPKTPAPKPTPVIASEITEPTFKTPEVIKKPETPLNAFEMPKAISVPAAQAPIVTPPLPIPKIASEIPQAAPAVVLPQIPEIKIVPLQTPEVPKIASVSSNPPSSPIPKIQDPFIPSIPKIPSIQTPQADSVKVSDVKPTRYIVPGEVSGTDPNVVNNLAKEESTIPVPEKISQPIPQITPQASVPKVESAPQQIVIEKPITTTQTKPLISTLSSPTLRPTFGQKAILQTNEISDLPPSNTFSSKDAMIYSYSDDITRAGKVQTQTQAPAPKIKRVIKWKPMILVASIILVIGGISFAVFAGYINIPSFIKKNPSSVIFSAAANFDSLKSYKTETSVNVTLPSIAAITTGLASGEAVTSNDMETVEIDATEKVNNKTTASPTMRSYNTTIKSSLMKNNITSNLVYDGSTAYVTMPVFDPTFNLSDISGTTVALHGGELPLIVSELPQNIVDLLGRIDIHKVLSLGVSPDIKSQIQTAMTEFIQNAKINQSGEETIKGVAMYHYQINADRPTTKKLLTQLVALFVGSLSPDESKNLDEGLGAATLDSLDVWVGKSDSQIHQYQFSLTAPLSKVIAFSDSGIAGKEVTFSWKKTYYDFDVANTITIPTNAVSTQDFIKNIHDMKIKNILSTFPDSAKNLSNAEGNFGKTASLSGSCIAPTPGSFFSPVGHSKGAITQVSAIATTMQTLLRATNNNGLCYSTPTSWSMALPLASDPTSYYCADSPDAIKTLPLLVDHLPITCKIFYQ